MEYLKLINLFSNLFNKDSNGFEAFITETSPTLVLNRLNVIESSSGVDGNPLTYVQFNQLLAFGNIPAVSEGFFHFYWLDHISEHLYNLSNISSFNSTEHVGDKISSLAHLKCGLTRIVMDSLLCFGNIKTGFSFLHQLTYKKIVNFFSQRMYRTDSFSKRGKPLEFNIINKEDRYLISEMACKTYEYENKDFLKQHLLLSYQNALTKGVKRPWVKDLLGDKYNDNGWRDPNGNKMSIQQLELSFTDILEEAVESEDDLRSKFERIATKFLSAREAASKNTKLYLSFVHDLDVYVATSMRRKEDFIKMANVCDEIFHSIHLRDLNIRYFDPTLSAADSHEDKGLIECLMVKCCKALVYCAGEKESFGKDAEAAMALSLGKPVIFLCETTEQQEFYKNIHPLARLIDFSTGVANGAMVATTAEQVAELLGRIFENKMEYELHQKKPGYYLLIEKITGSTVRLQTNDKFLSSAFWNYYRS
jgi:hypothetical protein